VGKRLQVSSNCCCTAGAPADGSRPPVPPSRPAFYTWLVVVLVAVVYVGVVVDVIDETGFGCSEIGDEGP
jgi:hypothetical protein